MLLQMAKMLAVQGIRRRAHCDVPISAGPQEGMNNRIKTMKRQACGVRGHEFKVKILATHKTRYVLVG